MPVFIRIKRIGRCYVFINTVLKFTFWFSFKNYVISTYERTYMYSARLNVVDFETSLQSIELHFSSILIWIISQYGHTRSKKLALLAGPGRAKAF